MLFSPQQLLLLQQQNHLNSGIHQSSPTIQSTSPTQQKQNMHDIDGIINLNSSNGSSNIDFGSLQQQMSAATMLLLQQQQQPIKNLGGIENELMDKEALATTKKEDNGVEEDSDERLIMKKEEQADEEEVVERINEDNNRRSKYENREIETEATEEGN